jgi:hypothetical protein
MYQTNSPTVGTESIRVGIVLYDQVQAGIYDVEVAIAHIKTWDMLDERYVEQTDTNTWTVTAHTNFVEKTGDTMTGPLLSTVDHSVDAPQSQELVTADWVRSLAMAGVEWFYTATPTNGYGEKTTNFVTLATTVPSATFTNVITGISSDTYIAGGVATQLFGSVRSPISFEIYAARVGGNATTVIQAKPEVYYVYNGTTNQIGDFDTAAQNIGASTTPTRYMFTVAFPEPAITGSVYIVGYLKTGTLSGTAASALNIYGGALYPSHLDIEGVPAGETAADVQANLDTHTALEGTNVHGLGTMAMEAAANYPTLAGDNVFTGATNQFGATSPIRIGKASSGESSIWWDFFEIGGESVLIDSDGASLDGTQIIKWASRELKGMWNVTSNATTGTHAVNYQTATGLIATAVAPYVQTNHTGDVSLSGTLTVESRDGTDFTRLKIEPDHTTSMVGLRIIDDAGGTPIENLITIGLDNVSFNQTVGVNSLTVENTLSVQGTNIITELAGKVQTNHTGNVSISGMLTAGSYSATITPWLINATTNITISAANGMQQAVTGAVPASVTINFPAGSATSETTLSLTFPPRGTNAVTLAAGPTYYYVSPLSSTNAASTNLYTRYYVASPYGTTNVSVTVQGEVQ